MGFSTRFVALLGLSTVMLIGCAGVSPTAAPRTDITWKGVGSVETDRAPMSGDYAVAWSMARCPAGVTPTFAAYLHGHGLASATITPFAFADGFTYVHNLVQDDYYAAVVSTCSWAMVLKPT